VKVLHVIPAVAPRYGGPSYAIIGMGRALARAGVDVLVATTDADGPGRLPCDYGKVTEYQDVPTIFFPRQLSEAFKYSRPLGPWLAAHVQDYGVVHLHAVFSHTSIAGASVCRRARVPYVVRPLGSLDPWSLRQRRLLKGVLWHAGVKQMLQGAAAIHYTTEAERRLAEGQLGLGRGVVIPLGVELDLLRQDQGDATELVASLVGTNGPFCLILSRLHPKKGIERFIDAWLAITDVPKFHGWTLIIAGDGDSDYVSSLKQRVASRGGARRVRFAGWVAGENKRALLSRAAFLALPSQQENFGIVVAEALSCGTPVLVSDDVGLASEVQSSQLGWVTTRAPTELRRCVTEILTSDEERHRRGAAGRSYAARHFGWSQIAQGLIALYNRLCSKP
jgi:glycosyltransferase involved in cell wall biosynthesis